MEHANSEVVGIHAFSYDLYAWQCFHAFHANGMLAGTNGVIYGVTEDARLLWYQHTGQPDGSANWAHPDGKLVGSRPPPHPRPQQKRAWPLERG